MHAFQIGNALNDLFTWVFVHRVFSAGKFGENSISSEKMNTLFAWKQLNVYCPYNICVPQFHAGMKMKNYVFIINRLTLLAVREVGSWKKKICILAEKYVDIFSYENKTLKKILCQK